MNGYLKVFYFRNARFTKVQKLDPCVIKCYDLTMVLSGELSYWVNGVHRSLQTGDVMLLPPGTLRSRDFCSKETHYISFNFDMQQSIDLPMFMREAVTHEIRSLFKAFTLSHLSYMNGSTKKATYILGYILEVLIDNNQKANQNPHIQKAIEYITKHVSEPITLSTLADHLHLTREYVAYLFKKETGMTTSSFINDKKLLYACDLILGGEDTLLGISKLLGYENYGYFSRIFKRRFGVSPAQYKKQH